MAFKTAIIVIVKEISIVSIDPNCFLKINESIVELLGSIRHRGFFCNDRKLDGFGLVWQVRVLDLQLIIFLWLPLLAKYKGWIVFDFKLLEDIVGAGMRAGGLNF